MTGREIAYNLGREARECEWGFPSQRERAEALSSRLAVSAVERFLVRAYARGRGGA